MSAAKLIKFPLWEAVESMKPNAIKRDFVIVRDGNNWMIKHYEIPKYNVAMVASPVGEVSYATASKLLTMELITGRLKK